MKNFSRDEVSTIYTISSSGPFEVALLDLWQRKGSSKAERGNLFGRRLGLRRSAVLRTSDFQNAELVEACKNVESLHRLLRRESGL